MLVGLNFDLNYIESVSIHVDKDKNNKLNANVGRSIILCHIFQIQNPTKR